MATAQLDPSLYSLPAGTIADRPQQRVWVRKLWQDAWTPMPYLECMECVSAAAPGMPSARFRWRYGSIKREDANALTVVLPADLKDYYVCVEILPPALAPLTLWVGIFSDEAAEDMGTSQAATGSGDQILVAYGLQHALDRIHLSTSKSTDDGTVVPAGDGSGGPTYVTIDRPLVFNEQYVVGFAELGNRSQNKARRTEPTADSSTPSAYVFANDRSVGDLGTPWTVKDILEYLLVFFSPKDIQFTLGGQIDAVANLVLPKIDLRHRTLFAALNEVLDRRRGLGWRLDFTTVAATAQTPGTFGNPQLHVFTTVDQDVILDDVTLPKNPDPYDFDLAAWAHLPNAVRYDIDTLSTYGKIVVYGEPIVACFTVCTADNTLEGAWDTPEIYAYQSVSGDSAQEKDERRHGETLRHVYSHYRIPKAWGWLAGDGKGGTRNCTNPSCKTDGTLQFTISAGVQVPKASPVRNWGHTLLRSLPLFKKQNLVDGEPEFREPLVLLKDPLTKRYRHVEHVVDPSDVSGHVRMLDRDFGFEISMHANHLLALNHWNPAAGDTATQPKYDYDTLIATVAARTDTRVSVSVDLNAAGAAAGRTLEIYVPDAETWYLAPNTVLDIDPDTGALVRATQTFADTLMHGSGFVVRDDSPRLRQTAALAKAWYGRPHAALSIELKDIIAYVPGWLVGNVTDNQRSKPVNSVITEVAWNLEQMSTTVRTNFCELDFAWTRRAKFHTIH